MNLHTTEEQIGAWHSAKFGRPDLRIVGCKLAEEAGEVCGALIKKREGRATADDLRDEIGDVLICLTAIADRYCWTLSEILSDRFEAILERDRNAEATP